MNRIQSLFQKPGEKLIPFLTAGYPELDSTVELVLGAVSAGADMIEIGIPFSDPQADGPIIQEASEKALKNGITLNIIFEQVKEIRKETTVPIALMGYYNPILRWGPKNFLKACSDIGVDGLILPDLPLDEARDFCADSKAFNISPILLVAPNTSDDRIREISLVAGDLIYAVSILGITGSKINAKNSLKPYLSRVRDNSSVPFIVGFGISSYEDVKWFNKYSDGAVVGSALIKKIGEKKNSANIVYNFIKRLKG